MSLGRVLLGHFKVAIQRRLYDLMGWKFDSFPFIQVIAVAVAKSETVYKRRLQHPQPQPDLLACAAGGVR